MPSGPRRTPLRTPIALALLLGACAAPAAPADGAPASVDGTAAPTPLVVATAIAGTPTTDGPPTPPGADASAADACADPTIAALGTGWNFVLATAPLAGAQVTPGFRLRGCGDTFEASFGWRLRDASGAVLAEDFAMMTCGTGCVGTFDVAIDYPPPGAPTLASLEVFTENMADGAEVLRAMIPLVLH